MGLRRFEASRLAFAAAVFGALSATARAADIDHTSLDDGGQLITIIGDIAPGDEEKFRRLSVRFDDAVVALASDGGALLPAIEIGKMVRLKEFPTVVLDDYECSSACALIWVAGSPRFLAPRGRVGFHASYRDEGGDKVETGLGNALVGRYLTLLNLPEKAVLFATAAPPDSVLWLTTENMHDAGIEFEIFGEKPTAPPPIVRTTGPVASNGSTGDSGWQRVASAGGAIYYLSRDLIRREGAYLSAWTKTDHSGDETVSYYGARNLWYYDCPSRRMALKATTTYDRNGGVDESAEVPASELEWQSVVPESVGEASLEFVCG